MNSEEKKCAERQAFWDYVFNRFMPWIIIGGILFISFGFWDWRPYAVLAILAFVERNSYNIGYSVCFCKDRNLVDFDSDSIDRP